MILFFSDFSGELQVWLLCSYDCLDDFTERCADDFCQ